jgi:hypothetical protein
MLSQATTTSPYLLINMQNIQAIFLVIEREVRHDAPYYSLL